MVQKKASVNSTFPGILACYSHCGRTTLAVGGGGEGKKMRITFNSPQFSHAYCAQRPLKQLRMPDCHLPRCSLWVSLFNEFYQEKEMIIKRDFKLHFHLLKNFPFIVFYHEMVLWLDWKPKIRQRPDTPDAIDGNWIIIVFFRSRHSGNSNVHHTSLFYRTALVLVVQIHSMRYACNISCFLPAYGS